MSFDSPLMIEPQSPANAAVIWLHGLGADGYDFEPVVPQLLFPKGLNVRFVFPHANVQNVTLNGGLPCRAWFDIYTLSELGNEDLEGMEKTHHYIVSLIESQMAAGIPTERIILMGFSQGGAMALYTGLTFDKPLAGIMGLSTVLGGSEILARRRHPANQNTPVFIAHGEQDDILPFAYGEQTVELLREWGYSVQWAAYPMGHTLCPEELRDLLAFLQLTLS